MKIFKRAYLPYLMVLAGVALIFVWARTRSAAAEGFAAPAPAADAKNADYTFTMYYADWCPHCKTAKPEFAQLGATQTIGGKTVANVAIEAEKNPELVKSKVEGYPTFHLYDASGKLVKEYNGPQRTAAAFQDFLKQAIA